jgi:integrase
MSSIEKRQRGGTVRWRAHFRDPAGAQRSRSFTRRIDAERFLTTIDASKLSGSFIDPSAARLTVGIWSGRWLQGRAHLKPSTAERYAGIVREHIEPRWGTTRLADVSHADVQRWVTELSAVRSPATVRKVHRVLSLVLDLAVRDGRLVRNPAARVSLPRVVAGERRYLTHAQVHDLAAECVPHRLVVLWLAYTGCRFGEMAALRVGRLALMRRRAVIAESVTVVGGAQVWGTPKGHERREVPIPRFLIDELAAHVAGKGSDDLVFTGVKGGALRAQVFQRSVLKPAAERLGLAGLHPHELRHTAASLAIASGANVKVVQQMLGHKSATMTLDLYGHLFGDQLDEVADRLDAAARSAVAHPLPQATVTPLKAVGENE